MRWLRHALGLAGMVGFVVALLGGFFQGAPGWAQVGALCLLLGLLLPAVSWRLREPPEGAVTQAAVERASDLLRDLEFGALLLFIAHAFVQLSGPLGQELSALIYLLLAFLVSFHSARVGLALVGLALGLEVALFVAGQSPPGLGRLALRCALLALFGATHLLFTRAELRRQQLLHLSLLEADRAARGEQARQLRLRAGEVAEEGNPQAQAQLEEGLLQDAVEAIRGSVDSAVRLLHEGLGCHSVVLLWLDEDGQRLNLRAARSDGGGLVSWLHAGEGALAGVIRRRESVNLQSLRPDYRGLTYYREGAGAVVRAFLGVPVLEERRGAEPALLGLLCLDRAERDRPFTAREEAVAREAAASMVRALQTERLFLTMERAHFELSRFYEASRQLGRALTPKEVYEVALSCAWDICQQDLAVLVLAEDAQGARAHRVATVQVAPDAPELAALAPALEGLRFGDNQGLVAMAIRLRHTLPHRGEHREGRSVVFTPETPLRGARSLLVLPLVSQEREVGAFVLAHREEDRFTGKRRVMLEVIAQQVATSVANAQLYAQMEEMATTDALTGLFNRRVFKERLAEAIARCERGAGAFSLLLTDIDHFKRINDTWGHPVGDEVLRRVSGTFREVLRQTDVPARYGGEEFVVILEGTALEGAALIAERLRVAVGALRFEAPQGGFQISMSFGVAAWPEDARDGEALIDRADQALYFAKKSGRDQVRLWRRLPALVQGGASAA
jgi:two-component system cell cycle response regulator